MKQPKLKLTNQESDLICWEESYYLDNVRKDTKRAARYAWRQAVKAFPRLAAYERPTP